MTSTASDAIKLDRRRLPLEQAPRTRADCAHGPRPCPWIRCRHHQLWSKPRYELRRATDDELVEAVVWMASSCTLDVADEGPASLQVVADAMGFNSRERARQIEGEALAKVRGRLADLLGGDEPDVWEGDPSTTWEEAEAWT